MADAGAEQGGNFDSESDEMVVPWRQRHIFWADVVPVVQVVEGDPTKVQVNRTNKMGKTSVDHSQPPTKMATTQLGKDDTEVFQKPETKANFKAMPVPTAEEEEVKQQRRSRLPPRSSHRMRFATPIHTLLYPAVPYCTRKSDI